MRDMGSEEIAAEPWKGVPMSEPSDHEKKKISQAQLLAEWSLSERGNPTKKFLIFLVVVALLFGSVAVWAILELSIIAYAIFAFLVVVVYGVVKLLSGRSKSNTPAEYHPMRQKAPHVPGYQFKDMGDYLDWANRRGRWADK